MADNTLRRSADSAPPTEQRHPDSLNLDQMTALEILELLNIEDLHAMEAVRAVLPELAALVQQAVDRVRAGGRVHYFGAGTSGRLAVLDAAELIPTFNSDPNLVVAHIAGGERAVTHAVEGAEDSIAAGAHDAAEVSDGDVVIGIAASGGTPYVSGALAEARRRGAFTAVITSNPDASLNPHADIVIAPPTGPEVLTGSTRLKAGTAAKVILNGFSTALMVGLGRTYSNLMVSVLATNQKLRERTLRILGEISGKDEASNAALIAESGGDLKIAAVAALTEVAVADAEAALVAADGSVREAVRRLTER